jgi:putative ABC transport system permease protein
VLLANVIAWPLAYFAMDHWLQDYAYRVPISWWVFALAGVLALAIALITVSILALRAAVANPVNSLRSE